MILSEILHRLSLTHEAGDTRLNAEVTGGYAGDLLSCAMAGARPGNLWITLQGHANIVAVAVLNELAGIIVTEGKPIGADTLARANTEGIPIFSTTLKTYEVAGRLWEMGVASVAGDPTGRRPLVRR
jgi:hypothetical protein